MTGEHIKVNGRRLGRRPANETKLVRSLFLGKYVRTIPDIPLDREYFSKVPSFGVYGNDQWGDCGPVSVANYRRILEMYLGQASASAFPTQNEVIDLYKRSGNPNFPYDDNGVVMQEMLEELLRNGIGQHKPIAFARVGTDARNIDDAIALFGGVLLGVNLQLAQQRQTDMGRWSYDQSGDWGGHAVIAGRYTTTYPVSVVTWGSVVDVEPSFLSRQVDEAWVVIWPEHVGDKRFLESVDMAALARDYQELTGRPFPSVQPPAGGGQDSFLVAFDSHHSRLVRYRAHRAGVSPDKWIAARINTYLDKS